MPSILRAARLPLPALSGRRPTAWMCAVATGLALAAAVDGAPSALATLESEQVVAAGAATTDGPNGPYTHSLQVVFMSGDGQGIFWSRAQLDGYIRGMASYWRRESHGVVVDFTYSWQDVIAVDSPAACAGDFTAVRDAAAMGLARAGKPVYNWTNNTAGRHLVVISPWQEHGVTCMAPYSGVATVGLGPGSTGSLHVLVEPGDVFPADHPDHTFAHEMGHNLGLMHAGAAACAATTGVVDYPPSWAAASLCPYDVYGNDHNLMGRGTYALNVQQKAKLGVIEAGVGYSTVTEPALGVEFDLLPAGAADPTVLRGLRITDHAGAAERTYWVGYQTESDQGGVEILREARADLDPLMDAAAAVDTVVEYLPGHTRSLWRPGEAFVSDSGHLRVAVVSAGPGSAHVRVDLASEPLGVGASLREWTPVAAGESVSVIVDPQGGTWAAASSESWLSVSPPSGTGRTTALTAEPNVASSPRSATVTLSTDGALASHVITVTQAAAGDDCAENPGSPLTCPWPIGVSPTVAGVFEGASDIDTWTVTVPTTGPWALSVGGMGNVFVRLFDPDNALIDSFGLGEIPGVVSARTLQAGMTYVLMVSRSWGQAPGPYTLTARPAEIAASVDSWAADSSGDSLRLAVTADRGAVTAASGASWLTVTPMSSDHATYGAIVELTASPNAGLARTTSVTLAAAYPGGPSVTIPVTQAGGAIGVSLTMWHVPVAGGTQSVQVTSPGAWQVVEAPSWVTVTPHSGSSGDTVAVTVASNTAGARFGVVSLASGSATVSIEVSQDANPAALLAVVESGIPVPGSGGSNGDFSVLSGSPWSVASRPSWARFLPDTGGAGVSHGSQYVTEINVGPEKSGEFVIANTAGGSVTVPVRQSTLEATAWDVGASPSIDSGPVVITDIDAWYRVTVPAGTPGNTWVFMASSPDFTPVVAVYNAAGQYAGSPREGYVNDTAARGYVAPGSPTYVRITDRWGSVIDAHTVTAIPGEITVAPTSWAAPGHGGSTTATVSSVVGSLTPVDVPEWLEVSPTYGSGPVAVAGMPVVVTAEPNSGAARSGTVSFIASGVPGATLTVTQEAWVSPFAATPAAIHAPAQGLTSAQVEVTADVPWQLAERPSWVTLDPESGATSGTVSLGVAPNLAATSRAGTVVLEDQYGVQASVAVTQAGADVATSWDLSVQPAASGSVAPSDTWHVYAITVPQPGWWSFVHDGGPWGASCLILDMSWTVIGEGNPGPVPSAVLAAHDFAPGEVVFLAIYDFPPGSGTYTVRAVHGEGSVTPTVWSPPAEGGTGAVTVTSPTGAFSATSTAAWLSVSPTDLADGALPTGVPVQVTAAPNTAASARLGIVEFTFGTLPTAPATVVLSVTQPGATGGEPGGGDEPGGGEPGGGDEPGGGGVPGGGGEPGGGDEPGGGGELGGGGEPGG
ncbi:MAG: hypothetical protein LBK59_01325, partial [Bifidobacteriaceae bacterium]|nr:hypothetical protein [Bifidobacteriaceae bacterium]